MTPNREDYLKIILELGGDTTKVNNKQIVSSLDVSAASVSEMISKLVKEELVEHSPYQGVQLTASGLQKASSLIRKHRLWEVFLVEHLDYSWNEVHDDAEVLEHVTSEHLADHLENYLNHPEHCPHGGSIPKKEEVVHEEKELLDYLVTIDLNINEEYEIVDIAAYEGPITIQNDRKKIPVSFKAASTIFVDKI